MGNNTQIASKMQLIKICDTDLSLIEYEGKAVITFEMIDKVHQRPEGTAADRFKKNRRHFIESQDFYLVDFSQKGILYPFGINVPPRGLIVLTETGYAMLAKIFTDDLAWQVQRELVNNYFARPPVEIRLNDRYSQFMLFPNDPERSSWLYKDEPLLPRFSQMANLLIEDNYFRLMDVPRADSVGLAIFFQLPRLLLEKEIKKRVGAENWIFQDGLYFVSRQGFMELSPCFVGLTETGASRYLKREIFLLAFDRLENRMKPRMENVSLESRFKKVALAFLRSRPDWGRLIRCRYAGLSREETCKALEIKESQFNNMVRELKDVGLLPNERLFKKDVEQLVLEELV